MMVGGQPMTSMMKEVLMGESKPTDSTLIFISEAIGRVMGKLSATAAELLMILDRAEPKRPIP